MDLFDFDNVKAEKASAMLRYNRLQTLKKLFRLIELCLALVLLSWIFTRLPFALKISSEYCRRLAEVIACPLFVFVVCNSIIITLFVKSGTFSGENPSANNADAQLYDELTKNTENRGPKLLSENLPPSAPPLLPQATEEIVYQDKQIIAHTCQVADDSVEVVSHSVWDSESDSDPDLCLDSSRVYRRTKSEKLVRKRGGEKVTAKKLRRSETIKCGKMVRSAGDNSCPEDELSDEEFQRAVDEFIAKQLWFRRQESLATVLQNQSSIAEFGKQ